MIQSSDRKGSILSALAGIVGLGIII